MKQFLRLLVLLGGAFVLYQGSRATSISAYMRGQSDQPQCCDDTSYIQDYVCHGTEFNCCTNKDNQTSEDFCQDSPGPNLISLYGYGGGSCGQPDTARCGNAATCPPYQDWTYNASPSCCHVANDFCYVDDDCCPGLVCDPTGHCEPPDEGGGGGGGGGGDDNQCWDTLIGDAYYCVDDYWNIWDGPCGEDIHCNIFTCACEGSPYEDPIIIDLGGHGYTLTSLQDGVLFDFFGTGKPRQTSWTAAGADIGFLALDRNGNGRIDNGTELFSNITPQPNRGKSSKGNGFLALAEFDKPENGGNGDGWITNADAVYSRLLVWVDKNHDGISQPSELFSLTQAGIQAISLDYKRSRWTDDYGNIFRYRSAIVWCCQSSPQWIYDVFLHVQK